MYTRYNKNPGRLRTGDEVSITCIVTEGAPSTGYQWFRDSVPLASGASGEDLPLPLPANESRLGRRYYRILVRVGCPNVVLLRSSSIVFLFLLSAPLLCSFCSISFTN